MDSAAEEAREPLTCHRSRSACLVGDNTESAGLSGKCKATALATINLSLADTYFKHKSL